MDYEYIERLRAKGENNQNNLSLRVNLILNRLTSSESSQTSLEAYIFLWLAFIAAYGQDSEYPKVSEAATVFSPFVTKTYYLDDKHNLTKLIWDVYPSSIRLSFDRQYVF
jgi:hypothetical protein